MNYSIIVAAAGGCNEESSTNNKKETKMKKEEKEMKVIAIQPEETKKKRVRKEATPLQNLLNEKMKTLRKSIFKAVKNFGNNELTEETATKINNSFNAVNDVLTSMTNEASLAKRFATLTESEREFLKKMLS